MRRLLLPPIALACLANAAPDATVATGAGAAASGSDHKRADLETVPQVIMTMLEQAMRSGNETEVNTIVKYGRKAAPDSADAIAEIVDDWKEKRQEKATDRLQHSDFFSLVTGKAELGGYLTTGNTHNAGLTASLDAKREGFRWRHKVHLMVDYEKSAGRVSRDHYLASYEPNYKVNERLYVYGSLQYESDHYLGYNNRYSVSSGAGYSAIKQPKITLDLELGPAFRHTDFVDRSTESNLAARGSLTFDWKVTPGVSFHQDGSAYFQQANSTVSAKSAISAKLFGPVSGQLSYQVQYESIPSAGRVNTDSTSRASIVYDF